jgi:PAS domain S-box-containing protein
LRRRTRKDEQNIEPEQAQSREQAGERRVASSQREDAHFWPDFIENTSDAVVVLDQNFLVRSFNPAACLALGTVPEEAEGRKCCEVLRCQNLNRMVLCGTSSCPLTQVQQKKVPLQGAELILGTESGHECEMSTSVTPLSHENEFYAVFTARDMSALKVANRVRSNFVSMVSHELRTPLNSVHGFIDLIVQGHMGELTEEQHTYLGYAQEGVDQLISIVEDILLMTRSDLGQFDVKQEEVLLSSLVRQVMSGMQPQAQKASVELRQNVPSDLPLLYADPQRIKQVLNNLLANAIKFTPDDGSVTISASYNNNDDFVTISVADTGYGIPVEDRPHIFERFYQSNHSQQSRMGGYGLGLSIAKLIVEQHGGTINFDTSLDSGTVFYFTLPVSHHVRQKE